MPAGATRCAQPHSGLELGGLSDRRHSVPTDESAPLVMPDPFNPRLSYAAGKIISEMMAINHGRKILRPCADLPAAQRLRAGHGVRPCHSTIRAAHKGDREAPAGARLALPDSGHGEETRSFCHIDDLVRGVMVMRARGEHLGIYHVGTSGGDHHCRSGRPHRGHAGPRDRLESPRRRARGRRAALSRHCEARRTRICAAGSARGGSAADGRLVLGQRKPRTGSLTGRMTRQRAGRY